MSAQGYTIHFKRPKLIFLHILVSIFVKILICVIRFAEFNKKFRASHVLPSLIGRAIEKFDFKRSQLERRENSIFRTFLEVNKPFATDLLAFGNYLF